MIDFQTYRAQIEASFAPEAVLAAREHARREFPRESCGFIVADRYMPCENLAAKPEDDFFIAPQRWNEALALGDIQAVVHSHPNGEVFPTAADMRSQRDTAVPWVIIALDSERVLDLMIWGDQLPRAPLVGRPFVHGVFDCYSLIRDYYLAEHALELPDYPRDDGWWKDGKDLYVENFRAAGFFTIDRSQVKEGDAFLMRMGDRSGNPDSRINHAAVFSSNDLILHHKPKRLSCHEPAGMWARVADVFVRHPEVNGYV